MTTEKKTNLVSGVAKIIGCLMITTGGIIAMNNGSGNQIAALILTGCALLAFGGWARQIFEKDVSPRTKGY